MQVRSSVPALSAVNFDVSIEADLPKRCYGREYIMKKFLILLFALLLAAPAAADAFTAQGCGGDCMQCHKMDKKEAEGIVKKGIPAAKITDVKLSPVKALWQVDFEVETQKGSVFIDFSKQYLLVVQQIVPIASIGKRPEPQKVDFKKIKLDTALLMGPKNAKQKIAVFTDPDCPYCQKLHTEMKAVLKKRKDVAFYIVLFPLEFHKDADRKSRTMLCEKDLALVDDAFAGKPVPDPKCQTDQIEKNKALAREFGFTGTPVLVRSDGEVQVGLVPADRLSDWIDKK